MLNKQSISSVLFCFSVTLRKNKKIAIQVLIPTLNLTKTLTLALTLSLILPKLKIHPNS